jgi:hypothetical protein
MNNIEVEKSLAIYPFKVVVVMEDYGWVCREEKLRARKLF